MTKRVKIRAKNHFDKDPQFTKAQHKHYPPVLRRWTLSHTLVSEIFVNLQILIVMEANEDDDMEVDDDQELVIIPVRDKGKDTKLLKAYSTSVGLITSMAALERHQRAKHSNRTFYCAECGVSKAC